jgi:hypothetical protein
MLQEEVCERAAKAAKVAKAATVSDTRMRTFVARISKSHV